MKLTKIRTNQNEIPSNKILVSIINDINTQFKGKGFITEVSIINKTSIRIGQHMRSFSLDLSIHDRNLQCNPHLVPKLTNLPTWEQRVVFNNVINNVLNKHNISCNIKSGPFIIRKGSHSMTENDWLDQRPEYLLANIAKGFEIIMLDVSEKEFIKNRNKERYQKQKEAKLNNLEYQKMIHNKQFAKKVDNLINNGVS